MLVMCWRSCGQFQVLSYLELDCVAEIVETVTLDTMLA